MTSSDQLFTRAQQHIPGGVNSPVRAFKAVGGPPVFIERSEGAYVFDTQGKRYIDYVLSWGPMIMGHNHPRVREAVVQQSEKGLSFGAPTELEIELAERICDIMPRMDMVRMVNSGTEATMSAIRLARGFTGRDKIVKFEGCYHGHADQFLIKAGSGALTLGQPDSPGVTCATAEDTLVAAYNDRESVQVHFDKQGSEIAAIIVEPVAGNMGCVPPAEGFLEFLQGVCRDHGALLIFDEVIAGFRFRAGDTGTLYGIQPDLAPFGKVMGGGMPVAAVAGKADIMNLAGREGEHKVSFSGGTYSGHPDRKSVGAGASGEREWRRCMRK